MSRLLASVALLVGAIVCLYGLPIRDARADRETAEFFAKRAERLLKENDAAAAAQEYRRSLAEDETYLPAHVGLGDALTVEGLASEAATAYRAALSLAAKLKPLPPAWADIVARARRRLAETDVKGASFERIRQEYADALVALADRWKAKDPALAERALGLAVEAVPNHAGATERLGVLVGKGVVVVFDGKAFDGFTPKADDEVWKIADGVLRGGLARQSKGLLTERIFEADLDVRMEARITKRLGDSPKLAVVAAGGDNHVCLAFGAFDDSVFLDNQTGESQRQRVWTSLIRNLKPSFDSTQWTKYELRLRGDEVTLLLNGVLLRKERRPKDRQGGTVGVMVQDASIEVRSFEVVRR